MNRRVPSGGLQPIVKKPKTETDPLLDKISAQPEDETPLLVRGLISAALRGFLWLVVLLGIYWIVGSQFIDVFGEFEIELPWLTQLFFTAGNIIAAYWFLVPIAVGSWVLLELLITLSIARSLRGLWKLLTWLLPISAMLLAVLAIAIPLVSTIRGVS